MSRSSRPPDPAAGPARGHGDVAGLHVAVHVPARVDGAQRVQDAHADPGDGALAVPPLGDARVPISARFSPPSCITMNGCWFLCEPWPSRRHTPGHPCRSCSARTSRAVVFSSRSILIATNVGDRESLARSSARKPPRTARRRLACSPRPGTARKPLRRPSAPAEASRDPREGLEETARARLGECPKLAISLTDDRFSALHWSPLRPESSRRHEK